MSDPRDHHYVPQFLLDRWCGSNGKLTVYKRVKGRVVLSELNPRSTAYERDLYSYEGVSPSERQVIETKFMSNRIDNPAAPILKKIIEQGLVTLTTDERSDFTRFVLSLRVRHPDAVALVKEAGERTLRAELDRDPDEYLAAKAEASPPTFVEWVTKNAATVIPNFGMSLLPKVIADDDAGERLFRSPWATYDATPAGVDFLIGDRPCMLSGNAVSGDFIIVLPLSPIILLLIARPSERIDIFRRENPTSVVKRINKASVIDASQRVFATGGHHMPLVSKYLSSQE